MAKKMKKFNLQNYTTTISAEKSINEIEQILTLFGASKMMKEFLGDGTCFGLTFELNGRAFKIPAKIDGVRSVLFSGKQKNTRKEDDENSTKEGWYAVLDMPYSMCPIFSKTLKMK